MRRIQQPGPAPADRIQWLPARGRRLSLSLRPGKLLLEAISDAFAAEGFGGGVLTLPSGMALAPFAYVMPALAQDDAHAAFYSATFRPEGVTRLEGGALTFGTRDGAPFFHGHALWREADGTRSGGHILPDQTVLAEPITVEAVGLDGAGFVAEQDAETGFKLFVPGERPAGDAIASDGFYVLRLRPNQDVFAALEGFCAARGISAATIHGGVGSTIGASFADGRAMEPFATEIAIREGTVRRTSSGLEASLDIVLIDYTGGIGEGALKRGDNPVLMTLELVIEAQ